MYPISPPFLGSVTCWREAWDGSDDGRCIWHADTADKSAGDLAAARTDNRERLERAVLREADLSNTVSFADCRMIGADLTDADLQGADLSDTDLRGADLTDANLQNANLTDVYLREADLTRAILPSANLTGAYLQYADLADAFLRSADLTDATLAAADLTDADLWRVDLTDADLAWVDLPDANLREVDFDGAKLKKADLSGADLRNSSFADARLHGTYLDDARCNAETDLRDIHAYDLPELQPAEVDSPWDRIRMNIQTARHYLSPWRETDTEPTKAVRVHRKLQQLLRENALPGEVPHHYVREKHARRRQAIVDGDYLKWGYAALQRWVAGYGERPWRVVVTSLLVVLGWALLYPIWGLTVDKPSAPIRVVEYGTAPAAPIYELGKSVYFSVITFTTLGYGDIQPRGFAEILATVESFLGALLMALLVAVLARRITR